MEIIKIQEYREKEKTMLHGYRPLYSLEKYIHLRRYSKQNKQNLILQIPKVKNQKVIGFMKDELRWKLMTESATVRP